MYVRLPAIHMVASGAFSNRRSNHFRSSSGIKRLESILFRVYTWRFFTAGLPTEKVFPVLFSQFSFAKVIF